MQGRTLRFLALVLLGLGWQTLAQAGIDVRIEGLGPDERDNAYTQIRVLNYAKEVDAAKAQYDPDEVQRAFEEGEQNIRQALKPYGWYNIQVQSKLQGQAPDWLATYRVDAGPQTTITKVEVQINGEGEHSERLARVMRWLPARVGERLKHADYEDTKARLMAAIVADGYADANFSRHELRVDPATNTAEVLLTLDTGPRYYFGDIELQQDGRLSQKMLMRYVTIKPGTPFDTQQLLDTQFALSDLDYFKLVEVEPQKERADAQHRVPVVIRTQSQKPRVYRFGAGYGTDTGPRAQGSVEFRRLNDEGHKLRLDLRPSQNISTAVANYKIPVGTKPGENVNFTTQGLVQDFQGIRETLYSFGGGYTRLADAWQQHYYLTYTNDRYSIQQEPQRTSTLLTPGLTLSRTVADDAINPRRGWFAFLDVHGGTTLVLSDTDFIQTHVKLRGVYPLARDWRLYGRIEEGATFVRGFDSLPPSQRFFAGGDDSVRGYSYQALAPKGPKGELVGGRWLTTGSVELAYDLTPRYTLAAFGDIGGADDTPAVRLHQSVGLGLRYRAPFGAIAVDLAHPLDQGATPVRLHLGVRVGL